jgi:hypothetical protein
MECLSPKMENDSTNVKNKHPSNDRPIATDTWPWLPIHCSLAFSLLYPFRTFWKPTELGKCHFVRYIDHCLLLLFMNVTILNLTQTARIHSNLTQCLRDFSGLSITSQKWLSQWVVLTEYSPVSYTVLYCTALFDMKSEWIDAKSQFEGVETSDQAFPHEFTLLRCFSQ